MNNATHTIVSHQPFPPVNHPTLGYIKGSPIVWLVKNAKGETVGSFNSQASALLWSINNPI